MKRTPIVIAAVVIAALGAVVLGDRVSWLPWSKQAREARSVMATEVLVMRTPGGLLEVSRIEATERFDKTFIYSVLGAEVGETTAYIRVPAVYRYHIELAPEWQVERTGDTFRVVTPPIRPTLPVAVDFARMEKDMGGTWVLIPFNREADLEALEREITARLAEKAASSAYLKLQRNMARKTVTEFVEKWLVTQQAWKDAHRPRIEVELGD